MKQHNKNTKTSVTDKKIKKDNFYTELKAKE